MDRRKFLQLLGIGGAVAVAPAVVAGQGENNKHRQEMFKWYRSCEKNEPITLLAIPSTKSVDGVSGQPEKQLSYHGTPIVWDDDDYDPNRVYIARRT